MRFSLWQFSSAILLFFVAFAWVDPSNHPALAAIAGAAIGSIVLLTNRKIVAYVVAAAVGGVCGVFLLGSFFAEGLFGVRDGNYALNSLLPGRITGAVCGWLAGMIAVRLYVRVAGTATTNAPSVASIDQVKKSIAK